MSRGRQIGLLLGGVALVGLVAYLAYRSRPLPTAPVQPGPQAGLSWLPAESGLVAGVELTQVREQQWLLKTLESATGQVNEDPSYRAFVEATGFDYARDLDRLWIGLLADRDRPRILGVAEGRFNRSQLLGYARQQGAAFYPHQGLEILEWTTEPAGTTQPERRFALAFLDDAHLAFASDRELAAKVADCWLGRLPAVAADEQRRSEVARLASEQQAWAVVETARWSRAVPGVPLGQSDFAAVMTQVALGLRVSEKGVALAAEARCREPGQAQRLRDNLRVLILAGRMALAREKNETSRALATALGDLTLEQRGDRLEAHVELSPETVAALLRAAPAPALRP